MPSDSFFFEIGVKGAKYDLPATSGYHFWLIRKKGETLIPWNDIFFQNWDVGALNFFLSVKNGSPEVGGRVYRGFPNPDLCTKNAQIWLKVITRRYSLRSLMSSDSFFRNWGKGAKYTLLATSKVSFLINKQKLRTPIPQFWKKIIWGHHESLRVSSWDHFKSYSSLFGALVLNFTKLFSWKTPFFDKNRLFWSFWKAFMTIFVGQTFF